MCFKVISKILRVTQAIYEIVWGRKKGETYIHTSKIHQVNIFSQHIDNLLWIHMTWPKINIDEFFIIFQVLLEVVYVALTQCQWCSVISIMYVMWPLRMTIATGCPPMNPWPLWWIQCEAHPYRTTSVDVQCASHQERYVFTCRLIILIFMYNTFSVQVSTCTCNKIFWK